MGDGVDEVGDADFVGDKPAGVESWHESSLTGRRWSTNRLRLRLMAGRCTKKVIGEWTLNLCRMLGATGTSYIRSRFNYEECLMKKGSLFLQMYVLLSELLT